MVLYWCCLACSSIQHNKIRCSKSVVCTTLPITPTHRIITLICNCFFWCVVGDYTLYPKSGDGQRMLYILYNKYNSSYNTCNTKY